MASCGLPAEVALAVGRSEKGPDGAVAIERDEAARVPVEPRDDPILPADFQHIGRGSRITKRLGLAQIFFLRDVPEFHAMLGVVLPEKFRRPESSQ